MENLIALVDVSDEVVGFDDKMDVHRKGLLHRAFSIIILNSKGQVLLQQRALDKYHSAGLWTNTCCSHLLKGFTMDDCIHKRLIDEMGFDCEMQFVKKFQYRVEFGDGLIENELDHIYVGRFDSEPSPNPTEVGNYRWVAVPQLFNDVKANPEMYTYWFKHIIEKHPEVFDIKI